MYGSRVRIPEGSQYGGCSSEEEHLIVVQDVVGSSPIIHPKGPVPKWFKGVVCKTIIRQFESDRDLILPHRLTAGQVVLVHLMVVRIYLG